jgi:hypothetical protein
MNYHFLFLFFIIFAPLCWAQDFHVCGKFIPPHAILKFDHFPGITKKIEGVYQLPGAPNLRSETVDKMMLWGVGQPSYDAFIDIIQRASQENITNPNGQLVWINLREEPVVYVNGLPYTLRDINHPFQNLSVPGMNAIEIEQVEKCLVRILIERQQMMGIVALYDELPVEGQMIGKLTQKWIIAENINTLKQIHLAVYPDMKYYRIPITDEKAPEIKDIEELLQVFSRYNEQDIFVFNCHVGKGRTSTAMVIADLFFSRDNSEQAIQRMGRVKNIQKDVDSAKNPIDKEAFSQRLRLIQELDQHLSLLKSLQRNGSFSTFLTLKNYATH